MGKGGRESSGKDGGGWVEERERGRRIPGGGR